MCGCFKINYSTIFKQQNWYQWYANVRSWMIVYPSEAFKKFVNKNSGINRSNPSIDSSSQNVNVVTKPIEK